jgi:PAS domain S-box-containing protein
LKDEKKTDETASKAVHTLVDMGKFIENVEDIIVVQDLEGKYLYYNAPDYLELKAEHILGKTPHDFFDSDKANKMVKSLKTVIDTGKPLNREISVEWNGETLWYDDTLSPIKDESGKVRAVVTISRNITKRKQSEEKVNEYIETLNKWQKNTVDRELKMMELKKEVEELKMKLYRYEQT